jgi:hypothetical protein
MSNLTFDDGEPIDITKLQNLYQLVLDVKGQIDKNSIQSQGVKLTAFTYASKVSSITVNATAKKVADLDYSAAGFFANETPFISVTPVAGAGNLDTTDIRFYVSNITSGKAELYAKYVGSAKSKETTASFHFIAVVMRQTLQ